MLTPWKKKLWGDYKACLEYIDQLDGLSDQEIEEIQLQRLQEVWKDCVVDVPYYRDLVKNKMAPSQILSWEDFQKIPELTRNILQERPHDFVRISSSPDLMRMTGGSTGTPVRFGVWKKEDQILRRLKLSLWSRAGYTPDSKIFLIWGHAHLLGKGVKRYVNHVIRKAKDRLIGYRRYDAYSLSPEICQKMARDLIRYRPDGIIGYASAIDYFLRSTENHHKEFSKLNIKFVQSAGELPPREDSFSLMENAFKCPVLQEYAGVDFGQVGFKVGMDQPFQIFSDFHIVEAHPRPGGDGIFDLGVTTLYKRYTPLIKYRNGDSISEPLFFSNRSLKSFGKLQGRQHETVELHGGGSVHSMAFLHCIHQESSVINIQLHLYDSGPKLMLATNSEYNRAVELRIRARLKQVSSELENMPFEISNDVEVTVAGKRKWLQDHRTSKGL